jgi:kynurenine formamidase
MPGHPLHPVTPRLLSGTLDHAMTRRWMTDHPVFGRVSFQNEQIVLSGHTGTHLDAPLHAVPKGQDAAGVDLAACVGPATRLDVRDRRGPDATISAADLDHAMGTRRGPSPIVLVHTGWAERFGSEPNVYFRHSMGLDTSGADWLRAHDVRCVGIDAPSVDAPKTVGAPAHMDFLRGTPPIYILENLRGLEALPDEIPLFVAAPLPIVGASGSPVRAIAILDD